MKIAIFPNLQREGTTRLLPQIVNILKHAGAECFATLDAPCELPKFDDEALYSMCDVVITIGGDGTLIKHAKCASLFSKPCIGINTGRLGFLASVEAEDLSLLQGLVKGDYVTESRMMLSVEMIKQGRVVYKGTALNDAVVSSGSVARITDIKLNVSGDEINYRADGVILSTPTGSTAYSMSAGGPIIAPSVRCLTVTPICSHSLTARPMILSDNEEICVDLMKSSRTEAFLTVDGERCGEVGFDTFVRVKKSEHDALLISLSKNTIYKTISLKF